MELYYKRKRVADGLLLLSAISLTICLILSLLYQDGLKAEWQTLLLKAVTFIAEATLIASVADYIAVTALTKQILWFKSTGLVPKKREEIIKSIVLAIKEKLFTKEFILMELEKKNFESIITDYLKAPNFVKDSEELLTKLVLGIEKEKGKIGEYLEKPVKDFLKKLDISKLGEFAMKEEMLKEADPYIIKLCVKLEDVVEGDEFAALINKTFQEAVEKQKAESSFNRFLLFIGEKTNILNADDLADEIRSSILRELELFKELDNYKSRQELAIKLINTLLKGLEVRALAVELIRMKNTEIDSLDIKNVISEMVSKVVPIAVSKSSILITPELVAGLVKYMSENSEFINLEVKEFFFRLIELEYKSMMELTEDMLNRLSDNNLIDKVNEIAGGDLQWLRISGSIIGLATGIFCFTIMEFPAVAVPIGFFVVMLLRFSKKARRILVAYRY